MENLIAPPTLDEVDEVDFLRYKLALSDLAAVELKLELARKHVNELSQALQVKYTLNPEDQVDERTRKISRRRSA